MLRNVYAPPQFAKGPGAGGGQDRTQNGTSEGDLDWSVGVLWVSGNCPRNWVEASWGRRA